jgi:hypothetical protein
MDPQDLCNHTKIRLIAAALGHQQCTATAGTEVLIPGTGKRILIGDDAYLARVALPAGGDMPALPWDLDTTKRSLVLQLRAGEVADAMHRYAEAAVAAALARRAPAPADAKPTFEAWLKADSTYYATAREKLFAAWNAAIAHQAASADERIVFLRQDSSFGPWIECDADHVNAVRFVRAHQAAPAEESTNLGGEATS